MAEQELDPILDNSDVGGGNFENALKRDMFDKQLLKLEIESFGKFAGDYGQYWKLKAKLRAPATDIDGEEHAAGDPVSFLLNVPGADASAGQWKAFNARLAELQINAMGLEKPDRAANMKGVEGKPVDAQVSVYTNPTTGKQRQQVDRFVKAS